VELKVKMILAVGRRIIKTLPRCIAFSSASVKPMKVEVLLIDVKSPVKPSLSY
jgi:hypothetical protein